MQKPLLYEVFEAPASSAVAVACIASWLYTLHRNYSVDSYAFSYEKVVQNKEYWRVFSSAFSHAGILHLVFNLSALWSCKVLELGNGTVVYLKISLLLIIMSTLGEVLMYYILIYFFGKQHYLHTYSVGYSCVVFGLMTVVSQAAGGLSIFGIFIPFNVAPFVSLFLTTLMIPQASFIGHLSGIVAGYLIAWNLFAWFTNYIFYCSTLWLLLFFGWNIHTTTSFKIPIFNVLQQQQDAVILQNGVITRVQSIDQIV